jgi:hypothetical protein
VLLKIKLPTGVVLLVKRMACACCKRKWAARRCLAVPFSASFTEPRHIPNPCKCTGDPTTLATVGERRYLVPKKLKIFL